MVLTNNPLPILNQKFECTFGKYALICKVVDYCTFGADQMSNNLHSHSSYELCLVLNGKGKFIYNDIPYDISSNDIILAEPYMYHEITCSSHDDLLLLYAFIDITCSDPLSPISSSEDALIDRFQKQHKCIEHNNFRIFSYIDFLNAYSNYCSHFNYGLYQITKTLLMECLQALTINKVNSPSHTVPFTTLEKAQDYIDSNLHRKLYIEEIAKHCCVSIRCLQYTFKKELTLSIIEYINQHKIKLACHYLLNHFSIIDTANLVGISDVSHFNKVFKKVTGLTPSQLLKIGKSNNGFGRRL